MKRLNEDADVAAPPYSTAVIQIESGEEGMCSAVYDGVHVSPARSRRKDTPIIA